MFLYNWYPIAEATFISAIHTRLIYYVGGKMLIGYLQDSVIGGYLLTRDEVAMDDVFLVRVQSNSNVRFNMFKYSNHGEMISGKRALSVLLPEISYKGKSEFCKNSELQKRIKFSDYEKNIEIELGEMKSGFFDKGANDVQTMIALMDEPKHAMDTIFSIYQAILNYNKYAGFSIGFRDILLSNYTRYMIKQRNDEMMKKGCTLIDQYTKNVLNEPIGKSRWEFLQECLKQVFNDEGIDALMNSIGYDAEGNPGDVSSGVKNALALMVTTGSKGSFGNTKLMLIRMGQALNDNRPLPFLFDRRLNAFYKKYDLDPRSHGMILDSYLQGLTPSQLLTNAIPERTQMLNKVLTVAKPGYLGRKMIKNLEPILVNNLRMCKKERAITEFLFAHDGFQVQSLGKYVIPHFNDSADSFINKLCSGVPYNMPKLMQVAQEHAADVAERVREYKAISVWLQRVNCDHQVQAVLQVPIMIEGVLKTRQHQANFNSSAYSEYQLLRLFKDNAALLHDFIAKLPTLYFNSHFVSKEGTTLPHYYSAGMNAIRLAVLCAFGVDRLTKFSLEQMHLVLEDISLYIRHGMVEPGSPIGVQVAQALQEYFTQDMLDSIHKTSTGDTTRDPLDRISDIFNNKSPLNLDQSDKMLPFIRIPLIPAFEGQTPKQQRERAEQIASNIKLIKLNILTLNWQVLYGDFERESDLTYLEDKDFVVKLPANASQWCLRVVLDKMKLFLNRISVNEIKYALEQRFQVHVAISSEKGRNPVVRIYLLNNITFQNRNELREITDSVLDYAVRGLANIKSASVIEESRMALDDSGALSPLTHVIIVAEGYNFRDIYRLQHKYPDVDYDSITIDNYYQTMQWFGLQAARQKIINEVNILFQGKVSQRHVEFVAAEMTQMGVLTNIEQNGIRARNPNNDLLAMADQRPISVIKRAALSNRTSSLEGCSASMCVGQIQRFGTTYNYLVLNEYFTAEMTQNAKTAYDYFSQLSE